MELRIKKGEYSGVSSGYDTDNKEYKHQVKKRAVI